jgi:hypothetical protein
VNPHKPHAFDPARPGPGGVPEVLAAFFTVLRRLPELPAVLDGAPGEVLARAIEWRRTDTVNDCALCPCRASMAYIVQRSMVVGMPRWLDLCIGCAVPLTVELRQFDGRDQALLTAYQRWNTARLAAEGEGVTA